MLVNILFREMECNYGREFVDTLLPLEIMRTLIVKLAFLVKLFISCESYILLLVLSNTTLGIK